VNPLTYLDDLVARAIMGLHSLLSHVFPADSGWAWGLSIVILVMIIRALLVPLFVKQIHAQRKMAQHQPQLQELRRKYKNDKQKLQEEQMKFFKENGVNPLAGCLPMIPQMIVFICLFSVLRKITDWSPGTPLAYGLTKSAVESARAATIFGVHLGDKLLFPHSADLGVRGSIIIVVSVAISASTTFMTVRQTSKRGLMQNPSVDPDNPMAASQKYMMYIVPFFSLTGLYWQYGLVLYWVTTNVWTVCQQFIMFRNWTPPVAADAAGAAAAVVGGSGSVRSSGTTTKPAARTGSGTRAGSAARTSSASRNGSSTARTTGTRSAGSSATRSATGTKSGGTAKQSGTMSSRVASNGAQNGGAQNGGARTGGTQAGDAQNGSEKRGRLRLGKSKPEPEPVEEDVPAQKVVRQQPSRQSRSKRSGNR
jgi:YidC/Oxa1 family membrane protein insertase